MKLQRVNEQLSLSDQLEPGDVGGLAADGVRLIVCNRPDGEAPDQCEFAAILEAAKAAGIDARLLPFRSGELPANLVSEFAGLMRASDRIHAYCRTGNRSFNLYAAALAHEGTHREEILSLASKFGVDVNASISPYLS